MIIINFGRGDVMGFKQMKTRKGKTIVWLIFLVYLILLIKVILFKYPIDVIMTILKSGEVSPLSFRLSNSNFIPMKTIFNFIFNSESVIISMTNILGNIIAFVPLGFLLPIVFDIKNKFRIVFLSSFFVSLVFEIIQLLTAIGDFDVDDIILNVTGSICGYILYRVLNRWILRTEIKK